MRPSRFPHTSRASSSSTQAQSALKVSRLGRRIPPVVVAPVEKSDRCTGELRWIDVVERGEIDRDVVAADLLDVPAPERAHAAMAAEQVMTVPRRELVVAELAIAREQPERIRLY